MIARTSLLYVAAAGLLWLAAIGTGHAAEPYGWRIAIEACRGADCRTLPASRRRWAGLFACQGRAETIARFGEAPRGRTLRARCVSVYGMLGA